MGATLNKRDIERSNRRIRRGKQPQLTARRRPSSKRPAHRGDCLDVSRPCPWVACRYHLFLDARDNGSIKFAFGMDVAALEQMPATCALDVAADGPTSLEEIGRHLNVSMERARQLEAAALAKFAAYCEANQLRLGAELLPQTAYVAAPQDDALAALGLREQAPWLKTLWRNLKMNGAAEPI